MFNFKVSVITPVFNAEKYVRRAVESAVVLQEAGEVILVDDAGPDNSLVVCRELEQEFDKVRLLQHPDQRNHGAGASRNLGIERARYDYIAFLDADDYYLPNRFEKDREILTADLSIDGVYGGIGIEYQSENAKNKFLNAGYGYQEFTSLTSPVSPEELIEVLFHCHPVVTGEFHTDAITIRRELLDRTGVFDTHLRLRQDIHLWRRMAAIGRLVPGVIDEPVAIRYVHGGNRMINQDEQQKYIDYWWEDLKDWFLTTPAVPIRARAAFEHAYCTYLISEKARWDARWVFLKFTLNYPSRLFEQMGFFDQNLFNAFGRNWLTLHLTSAKNRTLAKLLPPRIVR